MADLPIVAASSTWGRFWQWATRSAPSIDRPTAFVAGADFAAELTTMPSYEVREAMSAYAEFAWVVACCNAIATDLSRLPIRATVGRGRGAKAVDHPLLALLRSPSSRTPGSLFRRQRWIDLLLAGFNASVKVYPAARKGPPMSLLRLHPSRSTMIPSADGQPMALEFHGAGQIQRYAIDAVLLVRQPSWEDDPRGLFGQGIIRPLRRELNLDLATQKNAERAAKKGRPDGIASPAGTDAAGGWAKTQVEEFRKEIAKIFSAEHGGTAVLGSKLDYTKLGWSPVDLGMLEQRGFTRSTILAVTGVPPVRMGLETANYATAAQQAMVYWGDTLQGLASLEDDVLTTVAREWPGSESVEIYHDFSDVPALQSTQTERIKRVSMHIGNGMDPADAYAYEGLTDAPITKPEVVPATTPTKDASGLLFFRSPAPNPASWFARRSGGGASVAEHVAEVSPIAETTPDEAEVARTALWRAFIARVHTRQENKVRRSISVALDAQLSRVVARVEAVESRAYTRDLVDDWMTAIWPDADEDAAIRDALRGVLRGVRTAAFSDAADQMGADLTAPPTVIEMGAKAQTADAVTFVNATTKAKIREVILESIHEGGTIAEMAERIMGLDDDGHGFGPARALNIARTETTHAIGAGQDTAYHAAVASGLDIEISWLSARDSAVRPLHVVLDGQTVKVGERFSATGLDGIAHSAAHPGDFSEPADNIQCRCTTIAKVKQEE